MKDLKIYIIIASVLLTVYLVAEFNRPKPINWNPTLASTDKIPFGTYILYQQLHDIFPHADVTPYKEPLYNVISDHNIGHATYLIVCHDINLNEYDYEKLTGFIKKGNDVMIIAESFGRYFSDSLKVETESEKWFNKQSINMKFTNKMLDTDRVYNTTDKNIADSYFSSVDTSKAIILGKNTNNHINFIKYNFGQGALYLNADPLMFTNYSLLKKDGADYASTVLSNLHNSSVLIWDTFYSSGREGEESLMRVFLRNPTLRNAYYIGFFSLLIFIVYEAKRRQRIIPIIEPLKNSTLDFVNVVGQVYYEQRDNSNIAQKKAAYFLEYIRATYHLKTTILNEEFEDALAHKSGVKPELIHDLTNQITVVRGGVRVSDAELIALNKNIEQFYLQSR